MRTRLEVTKEEFDDFIKNYPNDLITDVSHICEPPVKTYNDFSGGKKWPESVVASVSLTESYPKEENGGRFPYVWSPNTYRICK
ncbi:hypothetical protein 13VV501A_gene0067 [Vibrio phage 13VV501A]|nr:hypothetical protein 13VV501A_gene0067 [Vibrio phage 13VV501A]